MAFCTYCGTKLDDNAKFCTGCGAKVEQAAPVQESAPIQGSYEAPVQGSYTAPTQSYTPPVQQPTAAAADSGSYTPPVQSYSAPQQNYSAGGYTPKEKVSKAAGFAKAAAAGGKRKLGPIIGIAAALLLVIILVASCGGKDKGAAAADDPNLGVYNAVSAEMWGMEISVTDMFENGVSIELMEKGKCKMDIDGTTGKGKWSLEDGVFSAEAGGAELNGTLSEGVLYAENVMDMGINLTFEKEGGYVAPAPETDGQGNAAEDISAALPGESGVSELQKQWNGTWFGTMYVYEAEGDFSNIPTDDVVDCYMVVDVDSEGKGTFKVYFDEVFEDPYAVAECTAYDYGMDAESGSIVDMQDMETRNWMFRPVPDYPDRYTITDSIEYDDSLFEYTLFFKQWGKSWQDEIDSNFEIVPFFVEDYETAIANGEMPPVGFAPIGYAGSGDEAVSAEAAPAEAAGEDYGKSVPDANGIVDFDTMKATFDWLRAQTSSANGYYKPSYEEIMEQFGGVHGAKAHADDWEEDYHVYEWITTSGEFMLLTFEAFPNGDETWKGTSWSSGLND
ncbi:MAG: zinc ribbon domain-containing protein [Clostridia bacterium]|nr:zinc ribbon domain-containing protein [Clostridia bacterium]